MRFGFGIMNTSLRSAKVKKVAHNLSTVLLRTSAKEYLENGLEEKPPISADYSNHEEITVTEASDGLLQVDENVDHLLKGAYDQLVHETTDKQPVQHVAVTDDSLAVDADGDLNLKPVSSYIKPDVVESTSNVTINVNDESPNVTSFRCSCITGKENGGQPIELVNSTRLLSILVNEPNVTNRKSAADCVVILFYARYCPFSSMAAPHFNALPRVFPDIKMAAVDAMKFHSFNTQYGIVGVPTVMLFHNGRPAAKFNESEYTLESFAKFISKNTGIEPEGKLFVLSSDFGGPVSSVPTKEFDYCLALSWAFIALCAVYFFSQSSWWKWIVETVLNTWRESEAQHEHVE